MSSITMEAVDMESVTSRQAKEFVDFSNFFFHSNRIPENWIWEYATYNKDKSVFVIARDNGRIIGTQGMMPIYMNIGGERVLTGKSESTLLRPEYRGQKIMDRLYEYAVDQCKSNGHNFIWGFTTAIKAVVKYGFTIYPASASILNRPGLNLSRPLVARFKQGGPLFRRVASMGKYAVNYLGSVRNITLPCLSEYRGFVVRREPLDTARIAEFQSKFNHNNNTLVMLDLDEEYLNWRIRKNPCLLYQEYKVLKDGEIQAYAFVIMSRLLCNISHLSSISEIAAFQMLNGIMNDNKEAIEFNIMFNPIFIAERDRIQTFRSFGFSPSSDVNFIVRDLSNKKYKGLTAMDKWNLTGLWTEGYSM